MRDGNVNMGHTRVERRKGKIGRPAIDADVSYTSLRMQSPLSGIGCSELKDTGEVEHSSRTKNTRP